MSEGNGTNGGTLRDLVIKYAERLDQHIKNDDDRADGQALQRREDLRRRDEMHAYNVSQIETLRLEAQSGRARLYQRIDQGTRELKGALEADKKKQQALREKILIRIIVAGGSLAGSAILALGGYVLTLIIDKGGLP